jgi:heme exporter protein B
MADSDLLTDASLIFKKDLRIERASKVVTVQVVPFAVMTLILFGFGISPDVRVLLGSEQSRSVLAQVTPGLIFLTVLFAALLALGRSFGVESADGTLDGLRLAGLDPAGIFLGKAAAVLVQLVAVSAVVTGGAFLFFSVDIEWTGSRAVLLVTTVGAATTGIAAAGTLYGALAAGLRVRDTLVPLLVIPVLAPVLLGAGQAADAALFGVVSDGWPWVGALAIFALLYIGAGVLSFDSLLEDA